MMFKKLFRIVRSPWSRHLTVGPIQHKMLEAGLQLSEDFHDPFDVHVRFNTRDDHAGFRFHVNVLWAYLEVNVYDRRHWNWREKCWYQIGEVLRHE